MAAPGTSSIEHGRRIGWPAVTLKELLVHRKEFIRLDDTQEYLRCRVQLHAKGVVLRDRVEGALIKTKEQQVCRAGEFLVAEIDAKVGGFGVVPQELDRSIVSSHYFLFTVNTGRLDGRFLDYYSKTLSFRDQVQAQGSTNYAAIRPHHVLDYTIPLPPLPEQRRIVAKLDQLGAMLAEAEDLRSLARNEAQTLVVAQHVSLAGDRVVRIGQFLELFEDATAIVPMGQYPQVGVRSFGGGLFTKSAVGGTETTYRSFNRLYAGAVVLSQVKGWEGAISTCPPELDGWFVSPEYRTFRCRPNEADPAYVRAIVSTEWFWSRLQYATRGVGARRERTRPEQFLELEVPWPPVGHQRRVIPMLARLTNRSPLDDHIDRELGALMPAILDRTFKGEL